MQRALELTRSGAIKTPALHAKASESESLYHPEELHLVPNYQDSEHRLYLNRHASKANDIGDDNALATTTSTSAI
jgi:hypothetical protein